MIKSYDVTGICEKLIGHISAIGETNYDNESYNNLDEVDSLVLFYLNQLLDNERRRNVPEYSIRKITDKSNEMLNEYREMLSDQEDTMDIKEVEYDYVQCLGDGEAVCPYCGCENFIESENYGGQDDETVEECGNCGKYFVHQINYTITFSSEPYENYYIRTRKSLEEQRQRYELNIKGDHNDSYYRMLLNNTQKEIYDLDKEAREVLEIN